MTEFASHRAHPTVDEVLQQMTKVIDLLHRENRTGVAEALAQQRDARPDHVPVVVVAGEDKRGKSSLVNALLAQPDLSPVGAKVVTGSPMTFFHATQPVASLIRYGASDGVALTVEQAQLLATVEGNPGNAENVSAIRIGLNLPLLEAMDLIDTPGVGGLASGHAELTLQSLNSADALLFVVDSGSPLRATELSFLRRAAQRIQFVVLVVTKIDVNPGWRTIMADDEAVLREHAPRFAGCPIVGVSSASSLRALTLDDDDFAGEVRTESGIAALERLLRTEVAASIDIVRLQNLLRAAISSLVALERDLRELRAASSPDGQALARLQQERARLEELREDKVTWPGRLEGQIRKLTLLRTDTCARRILDIRVRYQERARLADRNEIQLLPGELLAELTALAGELNELAARQLAEVMSSVIDDMEESSTVRDAIDEIGAMSVADQLMPFGAKDRKLRHDDRMHLLNEVGRGRTIMGLLSGSSAVAFLVPPFGLVLGVGVGGLFAFQGWREKARHSAAAEFRVWMNEQITHAQLTINNGFALRVVDLQNEMRVAIRRTLTERENAISQSVESARALQQRAASQQHQLRSGLERQTGAARTLRQTSAKLLADLTLPVEPPSAVDGVDAL